MSYQTKLKILNKIKQYQLIIISCHIRPDGDCIGATKGLKEILALSYPDKQILLVNPQKANYLAFLGEDEDTASDDMYTDALAIVIDTGTIDRVSNPKVALAKELIKIDHHIDIKPYGNVSWVEDERSSACEMIADFWYTFRDQLSINKQAATYLYTGMVTDTGRFKYSSVTGETMRLAGVMLEQGIDTDTLYAHLYLDDYSALKFQSYVYKNMQITANGVAYINVSKAMRKKFSLSEEQASNTVSMLSSIKNSIIWIAFIHCDDNSIRVRLRSRFVAINTLAEQYSGGGHANACGATVRSRQEQKQLIADADKLSQQYKADNQGWL